MRTGDTDGPDPWVDQNPPEPMTGNTKRDWLKECFSSRDEPAAGWVLNLPKEKRDAICEWAASVRDRELAGEVEKVRGEVVPDRPRNDFDDGAVEGAEAAIESFLALLSPGSSSTRAKREVEQ